MGKFTGKAFMFYEKFSECECKLFFTFVQCVKKIRDKMLYKSCSHWPASVKKPPSSPSVYKPCHWKYLHFCGPYILYL